MDQEFTEQETNVESLPGYLATTTFNNHTYHIGSKQMSVESLLLSSSMHYAYHIGVKAYETKRKSWQVMI